MCKVKHMPKCFTGSSWSAWHLIDQVCKEKNDIAGQKSPTHFPAKHKYLKSS